MFMPDLRGWIALGKFFYNILPEYIFDCAGFIVFLEQKYGIDIFIHGEGEDGQTFVLEKILSQSGGEKDSSVVLHKIQQQILIHCIIGREMKGNLQFFVKLLHSLYITVSVPAVMSL